MNNKQGYMNEQCTMNNVQWIHKKLGDDNLLDFVKGEQVNSAFLSDAGQYPVYNGGIEPSGFLEEFNTTAPQIIMSEGGNSCGYINYITKNFWRGGHCYLVKFNKNDIFDKLFFFYLLKLHENNIMKLRVGSGLPNIQKKDLFNYSISYPESLAAQRRIAAILSSADKVIDSTQRLIEKYKKMKQGLMEELLKPKEGWKKYEYKDVIIENRLGGNYENSTANTGYPVIKMGNIMRGFISLEKVQYLHFEKKYNVDDVLKKGDLLFNTRNTLDLVGKVSIWNNELPFALYNSNLLRMKFDENIIGSNEFMNYYFNYHKTLMELRGFAIGTTSVAAIYGRDLDKLSIIVPSVPEQRRIAKILSGIDKKIAAEEKVLEKFKEVKKGLMERLLNVR